MTFLTIKTEYAGSVLAQVKRNTETTTNSVARLSSGNRLIRASDDVAALAVSTQLAARVSSLKSGLNNMLQASSLFSTTDGGLRQINESLDRMIQLSTLASSGSLSASERGFLNAEYQQLSAEIDRIAQQTNFNGVKLLESSGAGTEYKNPVTTATQTDDRASAVLSWTSNPTNNQTLVIQGTTFRFRTAPTAAPTDVRIGANIGLTLQNLARTMNAFPITTNSRVSEATYSANGSNFTITSNSFGELARNITINEVSSSSNARFDTLNSNQITYAAPGRYILGGGDIKGLGMHSTQPVGDPQDPVFQPQNKVQGRVVLTLNSATTGINNGQLLRIDDGNTGTINFAFRTVANPLNPFDIQIGANNYETLQNAVTKLNSYVTDFGGANANYAMRQLEFDRTGLTLNMQYKGYGNATDITEANIAFSETLTGGTLSATSMANGRDTGISTEGVANPAFIGTVSGFDVNYIPPSLMRLSLQVGEQVYSGICNTAFTTATLARLQSPGGGYLDLNFAANQTSGVVSDATAEVFAKRLDDAFEKITFYQDRIVDNYRGITPLDGTSLRIRRDDFSPMVVEDIKVMPVSAIGNSVPTAKVQIVINGEVFENTKVLEQSIEPTSKLILYSKTDPNHRITYTNSLLEFDLTTSVGAKMFENALKDNIPIGSILAGEGDTLSFINGDEGNNALNYTVVDATTGTLFGEEKFDLLTAENAQKANSQTLEAQKTVTSYRAYLGSLESRAGYAAAYAEIAIRNQDASMGALSDADIAAESTTYANATARGQISVSMLSQANVLHEDIVGDVFDAVQELANS